MKVVVFTATGLAIILVLYNLWGKNKGSTNHILRGFSVLSLCLVVIILNTLTTPSAELEGDSFYLVHVILGTGFFASLLVAIAAGYSIALRKTFTKDRVPRTKLLHKYASYLTASFLFLSLLFAAFRRF